MKECTGCEKKVKVKKCRVCQFEFCEKCMNEDLCLICENTFIEGGRINEG